MFKGLRQAGTLALLTAAVFSGGCDNSQSQADKKVRAVLTEASRMLPASDDNAAEAYRRKLAEAGNENDASPAVRAQAKAAQAEAELEATRNLAIKIDRAQIELTRVLWEISQLTEQIRASSNAIAGYRRFDPKPALDAITVKMAEAQGGPEKVAWFTHQGTTIPTLHAATQQIAKLETDLNARNEQRAALEQQRTRALDEAEKALSQADQLKGDDSLKAFKQGSDLRKQAGDLAVEIDKTRGDIDRLQRNLAIAKGEQAAVAEVLSQLKEQSASIDKAWKDAEVQTAAHRKLSGDILGVASTTEAPNSATGGTIAQKAFVADRLQGEIQKMRDSATASAASAAQFFFNAYESANAANIALKSQIQNPANASRPDVEVWKGMVAVLDPLQFRLQQASAQRTLGDLHLGAATSLSNLIAVRESLGSSLSGSGLAVPSGLQGQQWSQQRSEALKASDEAYKESDEMLSSMIDGVAGDEQKAVAHIGRALTFYSWAQAARLAHNDSLAATRINSSRTERNLAVEMNAVVPAMPAELGPPPVKAPPPSETATTEPAVAEGSADEAAIRTSMKSFMEAVEKGDIDAAKAFLQIDPGQEEFANQVLQLIPGMKKFQDALVAKFGDKVKQGGQVNMSMNPMGEDVSKIKIQVKGNEAVIEGDGPQMGRKLVKVDGQWKMHISAPADDNDRQAREMLTKMSTGMATLTADIEAGKYATPEEATMAMLGAMGMPLGGPGGPPGGIPGVPDTAPAPTPVP